MLKNEIDKYKFKVYVNDMEVGRAPADYFLDPHYTLAQFLQKLGLKATMVLVIKPIDVLGQFEPIEIFPT